MNKIFSFLAVSNRYKHLIGGFLVASFAGSFFAALYAAIVAASCLELKDKLHNSPWDWIDWGLALLLEVYSLPPCFTQYAEAYECRANLQPNKHTLKGY